MRLQVISRRQYAGRPHLLLILPDESRGLIPVDWTDSPASTTNGVPTADAIGSLADLLHARLIIDALLRQVEQESNDATELTPSGCAARSGQPVGTTRPNGARCGSRRTRSSNGKGRNAKPFEPPGEQ